MAIKINENWKRAIAVIIGAALSFFGITISPLCPACDCPENQAAPEKKEIQSDTVGFGGYFQDGKTLADNGIIFLSQYGEK